MARQTRDARLQTRDARLKLVAAHEPYWHEVRRGLHVGYRKGSHGGTWWLREYHRGRVQKRRLAVADDSVDADGSTVLSWSDVLRVALGEERPTLTLSSVCTVRDALEDYWSHRAAKSAVQSVNIDRTKAKSAVDLTTHELQRWRDGLVKKKGDREEMRRSQATANRSWTLLRAALNHAYHTGKVRSDEAWRRVRPFRNVDRPRTRFLSVDEAKRVLNAMPPDFRELARGALYTGLRLGELLELRVADVTDGQVHVHHSKSGRARSVPLSAEGERFFQQVTAGEFGDASVFSRSDGRGWGRMDVSRQMRQASENARLKPPATFHDLRRSYASLLINRGTDAEIIKELLGHADLRMTLRAYAHLLNGTVAKAVRSKLPSFGLEKSNVSPLRNGDADG